MPDPDDSQKAVEDLPESEELKRKLREAKQDEAEREQAEAERDQK